MKYKPLTGWISTTEASAIIKQYLASGEYKRGEIFKSSSKFANGHDKTDGYLCRVVTVNTENEESHNSQPQNPAQNEKNFSFDWLIKLAKSIKSPEEKDFLYSTHNEYDISEFEYDYEDVEYADRVANNFYLALYSLYNSIKDTSDNLMRAYKAGDLNYYRAALIIKEYLYQRLQFSLKYMCEFLDKATENGRGYITIHTGSGDKFEAFDLYSPRKLGNTTSSWEYDTLCDYFYWYNKVKEFYNTVLNFPAFSEYDLPKHFTDERVMQYFKKLDVVPTPKGVLK